MDNLRPPKPDRAVRDALQRLEKPFHLLMEVAKQVRTAEEDERRRKRDVQRKEREVARKSAELLARKSSKELKSTDELKSSDALANRKSTDELKSGETLDNRKSTDELKSGDVLARETQRQTPAEGKNGDPNGAAGATAAPDVKKLNDSENTVTSSTATQSVSTTLEATEAQSTVTTSAKPAVETPIVKADANGEPIVERTATDAVVSASSPPSPTKVDTTSTATAATTTKDTLDPKKARTLVRSLLFRIPVLREVLSTRARSEYFLVEFSEYLACFNAAWTKQTRPVPTKECPYVNVDTAPLIYAYQMTMAVLYEFRVRFYALEATLLKDSYPALLKLIQFSQARVATSPHWSYLPKLPVKHFVDKSTLDQREITGFARHEPDFRYALRSLHHRDRLYEDVNRLMEKFTAAPENTMATSPVGDEGKLMDASLTATYAWCDADVKALLEKAEPHKYIDRKQPEDLSKLSIPVDNAVTKKFNPRSSDQHFLMNDPNNDGYLALATKNFICGATADGSGAGHHAHVAAQLALAGMYDLLVDDGIPEHTAKKRAHNKSYDALRPTERLKAKLPADMDKRAAGSVDALTSSLKEVVEQRVDPALERRKATMMKLKVDPVQFESTHDMMKFMGDAAMHAHKHMYENWGATTVVYYFLMKLDAEALLVDPSIKDQGATYLPLARGENLDDLYVMTYMVAGDVEGFWWDSGDVKRWQSLLTHPMGENIRINASITPGGIGKAHGDEHRLWGAYLWRNDEPPHSTLPSSFFRHANNVHFGQVICRSSDYFVFASDGLGDTLDPVQLFPYPYLIPSFDLFLEWDEFQGDDVNQKGDNPAETVRLLKEMAMDRATRSLFNATDPSVTPPTAAQVLDACVAHAMEASAGTRRLFADRSFVEGDNAEKSTKALARIREHIDLYFGSTESKRARTFKEYPAPKPERPEDWLAANYYMAKGKYWRKGFFLPEVPYVPHAKVDHLGIQVIKVEALKRAKNGTNGLE